MMQQPEPDDYVLATGEAHSVREFIEEAFALLDRRLEWRGEGVDEVGIFQFIPVRPHTEYDFSAFFKSMDIQGAGGPHFAVEDAYTKTTLFLSDELKNAGVWRQTGGVFKTGLDTELIALRIVRVPAGNAIRGKLWVGDFRLIEQQHDNP